MLPVNKQVWRPSACFVDALTCARAPQTLIYGSADGARTVKKSNESFNKLMLGVPRGALGDAGSRRRGGGGAAQRLAAC